MKRRPERSAEEKRRRAARSEARAKQDAQRKPKLSDLITVTIDWYNPPPIVKLANEIAHWKVDKPYRAGPERVIIALTAPAQPKAAALRAPTWLALVRRLPCHVCGPRARALLHPHPISEAHHFPPKGRSAGGSDLETMPLCTTHHATATASGYSTYDQERAVADTQRTIFSLLRTGALAPEILLAVAVEVCLNERA